MHDQAPRLQLFVADGSVLPKEQVVPAFHVPNAAAYSMESDKEVDINKVLQATGQVSLVTVSLSGLGLPTQDTTLWQQKFQSALGNSSSHRQVNLKYMDGFEYFFAPSFFTGMVKSATESALVPHSYVVYEPYHYNITVRGPLLAVWLLSCSARLPQWPNCNSAACPASPSCRSTVVHRASCDSQSRLWICIFVGQGGQHCLEVSFMDVWLRALQCTHAR